MQLCGLPSTTYHHNGNKTIKWQQHLPTQHNGTASATAVVSLHHFVHKITGHTNTHIPSSVENH